MAFTPSLPQEYSTSWRNSYHLLDNSTSRLSSYQAPNGQPISFVHRSFRFGGGQSVDTSEFPFYGYWSNNALNEKPQKLTITGHIIGENYIAIRNVLIVALQVKTSDDEPGFLDLPLWGRFPVVVTDWETSETGSINGSVDISITFIRAGYSDAKRAAKNNQFNTKEDVKAKSENLTEAAINTFANTLKDSDVDTIAIGFNQITKTLSNIVGRIQGSTSAINKIINQVNGVTNLISQGIRSPKVLAQALVGAAIGIVTGLLDIKNAINETTSFFTEEFIKKNTINVLSQVLSATSFSISSEALTETEKNTKKAIENLYKVIAFAISAELLGTFDDTIITKNKQTGYWQLFVRLEDTLSLEELDMYQVVTDLKIATAQAIINQNLSVELEKEILVASPVLYLTLYLNCEESQLRELNTISDSFLVQGTIKYV